MDHHSLHFHFHFHFHFSLTIDFGESYSRTSLPTMKIKRGSYLPGWWPPASLSSIKRGLGTERARLGTFRGFATARARMGNFRGFGTERARLGTFNQNFEIFSQNEHLPAQRFFSESFARKSKNRPTCCNFEKKNS